MTSKSEQAIANTIQILLDAGFEQDGHTQEQIVRIPTRTSPLFGKYGGVLDSFGGRQRFALPGTSVRATVGARTTAFYRSERSGLQGVTGIASVDTKDVEAVRSALARL